MIHYFPTIVWLSTKTFVKVDVPFSEVLQNKPTFESLKKTYHKECQKVVLRQCFCFLLCGFLPSFITPITFFSLFSHNAEEEKSLTSPTNKKCQYSPSHFSTYSYFVGQNIFNNWWRIWMITIAVRNKLKSILTCK